MEIAKGRTQTDLKPVGTLPEFVKGFDVHVLRAATLLTSGSERLSLRCILSTMWVKSVCVFLREHVRRCARH
jgi:hypothetical protein